MLRQSPEARERSPAKPRRLLFNCDGHSARVTENDSYDVAKWVQNLFTGIDAEHVGAFLWCDGSGGNTALYDSEVLELHGERIGEPGPWVTRWIQEGNDPPEVVVRKCRERGLDVFYSFRINDIHDALLPPEKSPELPTFKIEHPEWMLGAQDYGGFTCYPTALNFAVPEVLDLKFRTIEELFLKHDFDGIEIDFMRGPPFFMPGTEPDNAHLLTELLRRVRSFLDEREEKTGRPIEVAARVDETMEACHWDGFDVRTWAQERLIDILIMGSGTIDIDVPAFREAVAGTGVLVYPCLYGWPSRYLPIPAELARGIAASYWRDEPDGLYLFNWFPHESDKGYLIDLLKEVGSPEKLAGKDVMYAAERGRPSAEYPHNWLRSGLPCQLGPGQSQTVGIEVGAQPTDDARAELRVETDSQAGLSIAFDGRTVAEAAVPSGGAVSTELSSGQLAPGRHEISLQFPGGEGEITAVEIHVS